MSKELTPVLVSAGTYTGTIEEFESPVISKVSGNVYIKIAVRVKGHKLFGHVVGTLDAMVMIYRMRKHWLGKKVPVKVNVKEFPDGSIVNSIRIDWPEEE